MNKPQSYKAGQSVTCNGNPQGTIIRELDYAPGMFEVRLLDGTRYVGDVVVCRSDLDRENKEEAPDES